MATVDHALVNMQGHAQHSIQENMGMKRSFFYTACLFAKWKMCWFVLLFLILSYNVYLTTKTAHSYGMLITPFFVQFYTKIHPSASSPVPLPKAVDTNAPWH